MKINKLSLPNGQTCFLIFAGVLLGGSGILKLISLFSNGPALQRIDPVLGLSNSVIFLLIGPIEVALACYVLFGQALFWRTLSTAWISTLFAVYHVVAKQAGEAGCPCLGGSLGWLGLNPKSTGLLSVLLTGYLAVGSYGYWLLSRSGARPCAQARAGQAPIGQ
jgi:hypothetical protein